MCFSINFISFFIRGNFLSVKTEISFSESSTAFATSQTLQVHKINLTEKFSRSKCPRYNCYNGTLVAWRLGDRATHLC